LPVTARRVLVTAGAIGFLAAWLSVLFGMWR
jgi:hypothetical protein